MACTASKRLAHHARKAAERRWHKPRMGRDKARDVAKARRQARENRG